MVLLHIAAPLLMLLFMWVHISRHARARVNPARGLGAAVLGVLLALSLLSPAVSRPPADLDIVPATVALDWFYLGAYPFVASQGPAAVLWATAAILISFPVFAYVSHYVARDVALHPIKRLSPVRRWLTYLTLFVAATILIGDMTTLLYNLLGGELTTRFVLKVLAVAAIAGSVFGYYLWDLRREEREA